MKAYRDRAEAELAKVTLGLAAGTRVAPTSRTVRDLANSYLAWIESEVKARTYETYESRIRNYILPALGHRKVASLTTTDIRSFKRDLLARKTRSDRLLAVSTAREAMSRLHDMINYATDGEATRAEWGISYNPWPQRRFQWPDQRERPAPNTYRPYTLEETRQFVSATPEMWRPHILCAILLMLRDGELRAMRWEGLDEERGLYFVRETHSRGHEFTTTKTASSEADVPVPEVLLEELRLHSKRQTEQRLKKGAKWQDTGLIFTTSKGSVLPPNWFHTELKAEICQNAGIRQVSLHTLRKTGASLLESLGVSRPETQEALRHKRATVTDGYVAVYMDQRRVHIEQLAALLIGDVSFPQSSLKVG